MASPGKFDLIVEETESFQFYIVGLQVKRWPFNGKLTYKNLTISYGGCDNDNGNNFAVVGIAIKKNVIDCLSMKYYIMQEWKQNFTTCQSYASMHQQGMHMMKARITSMII